jgi:hypothetical protein
MIPARWNTKPTEVARLLHLKANLKQGGFISSVLMKDVVCDALQAAFLRRLDELVSCTCHKKLKAKISIT